MDVEADQQTGACKEPGERLNLWVDANYFGSLHINNELWIITHQ